VNHIFYANDRFVLTFIRDRVLYTPERLAKIATEAAKKDSVFSLSDRVGLLYDVSELSKAGLTQVSSLLTLIDIWRNETNCK
jgi:aminopeptidase 2